MHDLEVREKGFEWKLNSTEILTEILPKPKIQPLKYIRWLYYPEYQIERMLVVSILTTR